MSESHTHGEPVQAAQPRRPSDRRIIDKLNLRLNEKASIVRGLEDNIVYYEALTGDLEDEITGLRAQVDQMAVENRLLRKRLDLPESGAIELSDDEAAALPDGAVTEQPDDMDHHEV